MKKLLIFTLLLLVCRIANAQTVTIINHTDFAARVIMYAHAPTTCSTATCNSTYVTNVINLACPSSPAFPLGSTSWGPQDACDIVSSVGWSSLACPALFCTSIPSDFAWTLARVDLVLGISCWTSGPFPIYVSDVNGSYCFPATSTSFIDATGCGSYPTLTVTWTYTGGGNVTITIDQS